MAVFTKVLRLPKILHALLCSVNHFGSSPVLSLRWMMSQYICNLPAPKLWALGQSVTISHTRTHFLYLFILFVSRSFFSPSPFNSYVFSKTLVLYSKFVLRYVFVCSSYAHFQVCCRFSFLLLFQFVCVVVFLLLFLPSLRFRFAAMSSAYLSAFFSGLCYFKGVAYTWINIAIIAATQNGWCKLNMCRR